MEKIKLLLVDSDEKYLMPLERKFIEGFEGQAEINVISDTEYLQTFFSNPQSLDILIINENLYDRSFERHDIANVFILSEDKLEDTSTGSLDNNFIYKYTSVKEIFNEVLNNLGSILTTSAGETRVIMVYSPIGGIGKTTIAEALGVTLTKSHKNTLYINTESLQSNAINLSDQVYLTSEIEKLMAAKDEYVYDAIKPLIQEEEFNYLPPFRLSLSSLNISADHYIHLVNSIKNAGEFDYIILDSSSDFTEGNTKLMALASSVILIIGQDRISAAKLHRLLTNIDCSGDRFIFVCNKYIKDKENALISDKNFGAVRVNEYIDFAQGNIVEVLAANRNLQKLAMTFI